MANPQTLSAFLDKLEDQTLTRPQKVQDLMGFFCADRSVGGQQFPCLGITDHGPGFKTRQDVGAFFDRLLQTFPDMTWTPVSTAPPLTAAEEIGIQMDVKGTHRAAWFPHGDPHYSMPLSELGAGSNKTTDVPAFGVFSFDQGGNFPIRQIQIYLDRYKMMHDLTPDGWDAIHLPRGPFSH